MEILANHRAQHVLQIQQGSARLEVLMLRGVASAFKLYLSHGQMTVGWKAGKLTGNRLRGEFHTFRNMCEEVTRHQFEVKLTAAMRQLAFA